jgi:hypothetical protein
MAVPESELRQHFAPTPAGGVGEPRGETTATDAVLAGEQIYTEVQVPVLAIFANGGRQADFVEKPYVQRGWFDTPTHNMRFSSQTSPKFFRPYVRF